MNTQTGQTKTSVHPLLLAAGIAVILFCAVGIAAVMDWIPTSSSRPAAGVSAANPDQLLSGAAPDAAKPHKSAPAHPAPVHVASAAPAKATCTICGVVESSDEVIVRGEGSGLGAVGGAVVGGLLGHQVGGGRGKDAMTVVGAVGGAVAGNQIEKQAKSTKSYDITVRMNDGSRRVIREANATSWRSGDRVKIVDGAIRPI
jgi:outer membrane lipoprotein SlyB